MTKEEMIAKMREDLAYIGTPPLCRAWMYSAIRHCQRNLDFDTEGDGKEPERQSGGAIADIINALPALLDLIEQDARRPRMGKTDRIDRTD